MSSRFKKRLEQLHGSRQRRRARKSETEESRVFTADGVEAPPQDSIASKWQAQGAKTRHTPRGDASFLVRAHPSDHQHGNKHLAEGAATKLACFQNQLNDPRLHSTDPKRVAFVDLETNGLSKSSFPFCIGIGLWEGTSFSVYHYFTPSDEHEPAALGACAEILGDIDGLCTFNGRSFDVPMLERRFRQHGIEHRVDALPHLDLLHLARKVWPQRKSHKLSLLEEDELGFGRTGDIPGAKIPARWREYQKIGDPTLLLDIFDHNRLDILSMVVLVAELAGSTKTGPKTKPGPVTKPDPPTKLTSRLARSYALRDKAANREPKPPRQTRENVFSRSNMSRSNMSRSKLREGMPIGARLRELRVDVEQRQQVEGQQDDVVSTLHEMVALAPRNPFALQALVDHYRQTGEAALAAHFEKRLSEGSPF
jgi:uncharacterized protein YprB with RNaseH-like and TPR domain